MESPDSQHYGLIVDNECSNAPSQNTCNSDAPEDNVVGNNVPVYPQNNNELYAEPIYAPVGRMGLDATHPTDDSATPVKDATKKPEQATPPGNTTAHLVMDILDEVLSTPCSAAKNDKDEARGGQDQVETIEDIQAFMNRPVSTSINDEKITPEKDDKEKDHSKVVRKLNMETENNIGKQIRKTSQEKKEAKASAKRVSRSARSGLVFPVSRVVGQLRKGKYAKHIGVTSAVYLTAVLEYLVAEVLELSGNCAKYYNKRRVFPRCILLTLRHDAELDQLTKGAIVPQGGVKPFIHRELLPVERQDSHFHPRFGGFLSTQDMMKYNLKPSFPEGASVASPSSPQAD